MKRGKEIKTRIGELRGIKSSPELSIKNFKEVPFTILASDPSYTHWGWVVIRNDKIMAVGCIETGKETKKRRIRTGDDDIRRVSFITDYLREIIQKFDISYMVIEQPHGSQNASAMKSVGIVLGVCSSISSWSKVGVEYYSEADSKKCLLHKKTATKEEMKEAISKLYTVPWTGLKGKDEHIADAIAVYHTAKTQSPTLKLLL